MIGILFRFISGQIGRDYSARIEKDASAKIDDLLVLIVYVVLANGTEVLVVCRMPLVNEILKFDMDHNAEAEACDLLLEVCRHMFLPMHLLTSSSFRLICFLK